MTYYKIFPGTESDTNTMHPDPSRLISVWACHDPEVMRPFVPSDDDNWIRPHEVIWMGTLIMDKHGNIIEYEANDHITLDLEDVLFIGGLTNNNNMACIDLVGVFGQMLTAERQLLLQGP